MRFGINSTANGIGIPSYGTTRHHGSLAGAVDIIPILFFCLQAHDRAAADRISGLAFDIDHKLELLSCIFLGLDKLDEPDIGRCIF
ncbi:hypothetical protein D9M69_680340 [compost metagenome]